MDTNIYYIPAHHTISITSDFAEEQRRMDTGIDPKIEYIKLSISDLSNYSFDTIGFKRVENDYFQSIKSIFSKINLKAVAFHESNIDLSDVVIDVQHLLIGDKSKVNLKMENFKNLKEVTFLEIKTYKGKVLNQLSTVKKAVLWDSTQTSLLHEMLPNLIELTVNKGSLTELDLRNHKHLEKLDIHYCTKLEQVLLYKDHKLQNVMIENCKKLDISNLPLSVTSVWPPRKETKITTQSMDIKSTGNQDINNLILDLKKNMEDYMRDADPSYNQNDIDECMSLLTNYVTRIFSTDSKDEAMEIVKSTVLKLNDLNEKCDFSLIETNEREQIAEIMILAGHEMGYNSSDEDITEEWREW
ncbi:hypothetical protein LZQ00_08395 [Sphingobacterium sp. SRCM116780]|uniref:hypothetical protein n=1 Tax=Sphingobacterium sp. SRCM116780 TaxID=2907623 RepID=UPI001F22B121|nr:hypothetical protein [Sphingobacterium sp. SRCM116780]UIR57827.1 hypothetical protein LZQ00_08395 [Sphingobacterium sp. SRCM116780]